MGRAWLDDHRDRYLAQHLSPAGEQPDRPAARVPHAGHQPVAAAAGTVRPRRRATPCRARPGIHSGELAPGASVSWTVQVKARTLGLTAFGVYPLQMQVPAPRTPRWPARLTFSPYEPAKKSGFARPAAEKIAWLWPLIDEPLISRRGRTTCKGRRRWRSRAAWRGGRLNQLVPPATRGRCVAGRHQQDAARALRQQQRGQVRADPEPGQL